MDIPYLHGAIDRVEAERRLRRDGTPGSYLLRSRDAQNKSFAYSCLGNEMKIIHSKVDYTATGVNIDNKPEASLKANTPLNQIVAFLNNTRRNLGLVVGAPLDSPPAGSEPAEQAYNIGADTRAVVQQPAAIPAPTKINPVAFNKNAVLTRQEPSTSCIGSCLGSQAWEDRWAELREGKLTIYQSRANQVELQQLSMSAVSAVDEADVAVTGRSFCFTLVSRGSQQYFHCSNSKERDAWLKSLRGAIEAVNDGDDD